MTAGQRIEEGYIWVFAGVCSITGTLALFMSIGQLAAYLRYGHWFESDLLFLLLEFDYLFGIEHLVDKGAPFKTISEMPPEIAAILRDDLLRHFPTTDWVGFDQFLRYLVDVNPAAFWAVWTFGGFALAFAVSALTPEEVVMARLERRLQHWRSKHQRQ